MKLNQLLEIKSEVQRFSDTVDEAIKLANYNSGSHEFFLRFEVFKSEAKVFSPRFF
jgi:hypothetical protein